MFDVGFGEILLIMVIALVVLGPEKLPKLAADIGRWVGRARAMARQLSAQLEQEVRLEEVAREQRSAPATPSEPTATPPAPTPTPTVASDASDQSPAPVAAMPNLLSTPVAAAPEAQAAASVTKPASDGHA